MIDFSAVQIDQLVLHRVGNKVKEEENFVSEGLTNLDEDLTELLINYFLKPFIDPTEIYHFVHEVDMSYNEVNGISNNIFDNPAGFYESSVQILQHLYDQSEHPHIKSGELFVVLFEEILWKDDFVSAIGIFKSENKDPFIKLIENPISISINQENGINVKKLDKGALILNTEGENGFRVLSVDTNNYDAEYWKKAFLNLDYIKDDNFETKAYIDMCKSFAKDVIGSTDSKKDQIDFLNHSVKYFDNNERIETKEFVNTVFAEDGLKEEFNEYQKEYEEKHNIEISDEFGVSRPALKKQKRKIKNLLKLDTNIQIKLDFNNPESSQKFIEQGYDDEKEMNYYKVYFNKEVN